MRLEFKDDCETGQFIIYAENEVEGYVLRKFCEYNHNPNWQFWLHGKTYSGDRQYLSSFNFGYIAVKKEVEDG